jgi:hypothetical protein
VNNLFDVPYRLGKSTDANRDRFPRRVLRQLNINGVRAGWAPKTRNGAQFCTIGYCTATAQPGALSMGDWLRFYMRAAVPHAQFCTTAILAQRRAIADVAA